MKVNFQEHESKKVYESIWRFKNNLHDYPKHLALFNLFKPGKKNRSFYTSHTRIYALDNAYLPVKTLLKLSDFMRFYAFLFVFTRCYAILRKIVKYRYQLSDWNTMQIIYKNIKLKCHVMLIINRNWNRNNHKFLHKIILSHIF